MRLQIQLELASYTTTGGKTPGCHKGRPLRGLFKEARPGVVIYSRTFGAMDNLSTPTTPNNQNVTLPMNEFSWS